MQEGGQGVGRAAGERPEHHLGVREVLDQQGRGGAVRLPDRGDRERTPGLRDVAHQGDGAVVELVDVVDEEQQRLVQAESIHQGGGIAQDREEVSAAEVGKGEEQRTERHGSQRVRGGHRDARPAGGRRSGMHLPQDAGLADPAGSANDREARPAGIHRSEQDGELADSA
ncbi:hypothetical protein [Arsenicicoccus piscis]|uniref:Uncharacterized protein n=1 Tax=Arsenicicoccus piscis TaxID=673954 RepID=A0ABQ6HKZ1_9MICO|nr:hypothetical protein [Arsenicicoccus piscis]GMA19119.1 hypothetical protein GCM10025862_11400 [Arsenicicoccus piscis]